MSAPTIYLTNATSRRAPYRGPSGQVWTIMAAPRPGFGELGSGPVRALVPPLDWVRAAKAGTLPMSEYRDRYLALLVDRASLLNPGVLSGPIDKALVRDGDTLLCACSRLLASQGRCHRCWAASALTQAGWSVVLDGKRLEVSP